VQMWKAVPPSHICTGTAATVAMALKKEVELC